MKTICLQGVLKQQLETTSFWAKFNRIFSTDFKGSSDQFGSDQSSNPLQCNPTLDVGFVVFYCLFVFFLVFFFFNLDGALKKRSLFLLNWILYCHHRTPMPTDTRCFVRCCAVRGRNAEQHEGFRQTGFWIWIFGFPPRGGGAVSCTTLPQEMSLRCVVLSWMVEHPAVRFVPTASTNRSYIMEQQSGCCWIYMRLCLSRSFPTLAAFTQEE